jgi:hypothetical protein
LTCSMIRFHSFLLLVCFFQWHVFITSTSCSASFYVFSRSESFSSKTLGCTNWAIPAHKMTR